MKTSNIIPKVRKDTDRFIVCMPLMPLNDALVTTWDKALTQLKGILKQLSNFPPAFQNQTYVEIPYIVRVLKYNPPVKAFTPQLKRVALPQGKREQAYKPTKGVSVRRVTKRLPSDSPILSLMGEVKPLPKDNRIKCHHCHKPVDNIQSVYGQWFQTLVSIVQDELHNGVVVPVAKTVPKYLNVHLCWKCFKQHDGEYVGDTSYKSFVAKTVSKPNQSKLPVSEHISTGQTIDPWDDKPDANAVAYFFKGKPISKRTGMNIPQASYEVKPSPSTKKTLDMFAQLQKEFFKK